MVVMSVLSFSDNKYAGEQSRGKKAVEDILEDSTLVQADYPQQRAGNHLSPAVCDRKEMLLEADYSRQVPNNDHSDDNRRLDGSSKELNCAPPRSYNELFRGVHVTENPSFTVDRKVSHTPYEGASFSKSGSSSLEGWNQSNVKEAVYIDERNFFTGMNSHSFSGSMDNKKDNCVGGQGVQVLRSIFEPNNCVTPTNGKRTEINKGGEVDVPCTGDPMLISTSYTRAESRETPSLLHKLPGCISDQIMQSTDCKQQSGNQDGQSGLRGTENVGGQGYVIGSLFESNNCVIPTDGETGGINKGKEVYIPCNAGSRPINTLNTHAESGDSASGVHKLPDLACKANDYKYLSSGCISDQVMQSTECKQQNRNRDGKSDLPGAECAEIDQPVALWAKWRGKWKTGIQCLRADCPLAILKAKPTHDRKKYITIFFPRSKTYSWVDMLLVRSIDESPEPLAHGNHRKWRKLVRDLTVPRHYIMQRLSVAMLNISDQLHTEAVIENARKVTSWKEFAYESSCCRDYTELGRMLLKLQTMVVPKYFNHDWLKNSFDSWSQRCRSAQSAESIEMLTEELVGSVSWNVVDELWDAPVQPELGPEWKTWKQEAVKCYFTMQSSASGKGKEPRCSHNSMGVGYSISKKRPKLEVHRVGSSTSQNEASGSRILSQLNGTDNRQVLTETTPSSEPMLTQHPEAGMPMDVDSNKIATGGLHRETHTTNKYRQCLAFVEAKGRQCGRWASDGDTYCCVHLKVLTETMPSSEPMLTQHPEAGMPMDVHSNKITTGGLHRETDITNKYRQCLAFVEAKGRQCGRWASDGDTYCCVHLKNHNLAKASHGEQMLPTEASMCEGMTIHGRNCKHRAQPGSPFCKKHRLQPNHEPVSTNHLPSSSRSKLKRKRDEGKIFEMTSSSNVRNGEQYGLVRENLDERNCVMKKSEVHNALPTHTEGSSPDLPRCIREQCLEDAKLHTLYCESHLPKFLKRARNGKSRLITRDIFINILKSCSSRKEKLCLNQACELLYVFMKSNQSHQKPVSRSESTKWILSEVAKDLEVGKYLLKLISTEREKLESLWGFDVGMDMQASPMEMDVLHIPENHIDNGDEMTVKCKICSKGFSDDKQLGTHWTESHLNEGYWHFRGFACAVCMDSFTNREVLVTHVKEKHGEPFLEHSTLFRCLSCSSHFMNSEQLWQHALSSHPTEFRKLNTIQQSDSSVGRSVEPNISTGIQEKEDASQRFTCRFCRMRFDLLPDLGRHHQAAHMDVTSNTFSSSKKGNKSLKRSRHSLPGSRKNFASTFTFNSRTSNDTQKRGSTSSVRPQLQTRRSDKVALGWLQMSHLSDVSDTLFPQMQKSKPRPSNLDILSVARSACCRVSLHAALEAKFGKLPENIYLKAAKLCSELNIEIDWSINGFICPRGCRSLMNMHCSTTLKSLHGSFMLPLTYKTYSSDPQWVMNENHYVLCPEQFNLEPRRKIQVLCEDVSFGKESVSVPCVLDEDHKNSDDASNRGRDIPMPWLGFTYVTERLIGPSLGLDTKNPQLGCACPHPKCHPEKCDHVYLFDNDYENADDIHGKPMHGRFPYAEGGRIVLPEGYLVYECNSSCDCDSTCENRVLQRGVQVKMEIFRTENKGWAVRAGEAIPRGTFVCEYIGEVLTDVEANQRRERYGSLGCSYFYDIDAHIDGAKGFNKETIPYVIDATKYGNVSHFINHSCSPNLASYMVLVESMDSQFAHIGLFASQNIARGEEIAFDYRWNLLPGDGCPCHCGAPNCRGRLY